MTKNPFKIILHELGNQTLLVTMEYLDAIKRLFYAYDIDLKDYGSVFEVFEYLEKNGCLTIKQRSDGSYTLTGHYTYGE